MVVLAQVWACLIIAQVLQAIRMEVALRAQVDPAASLSSLTRLTPCLNLVFRDVMASWNVCFKDASLALFGLRPVFASRHLRSHRSNSSRSRKQPCFVDNLSIAERSAQRKRVAQRKRPSHSLRFIPSAICWYKSF